MKKSIALFLSLAMMFVLFVPAMAVVTPAVPIVYIEGQGTPLVNQDGESIGPAMDEVLDVMVSNLKDMLIEYMAGWTVGSNFKIYNDKLVSMFADLYQDVKITAFDENGRPADGSGVPSYNDWHGNLGNIKRTIPMSVDASGCSVYRWHYDWRLSPLTLAAELNDLITAVLADNPGATKVDIISRCLGSNIAYAYLATYNTDKVNSCVLYEPSIDGIGVVNALYTGNVVIDGAALNRFVNYFQKERNFIIKDEKTTDMVLEVIDILQDAGAAVGTQLFNNVKDDVVPRILKESFGTFPAYWSMASADKVNEAISFVFKNDADEYADLIDQINAYYAIEKDAHANLTAMSDSVNFSVIAKYGFPAFPLSEDANQESDVYVTTGFTSMGATCADVGSTLGKSHTGQFVSPDKKIDASTALFADKTWFIKDLGHKEFPDCVNDLIVEFLQNPEMTVFTNDTYPQYLQFTATNSESSDDAKGTLAPVTAPAEPSDSGNSSSGSNGGSQGSGSSVSPLDAFFKFLVKIVRFFTKLFKK